MANKTKPMIKHCRNCEYAKKESYSCAITCDVKYKDICQHDQRWQALLCWHYKKRKDGDNSAK